jgi:hypothetical protein
VTACHLGSIADWLNRPLKRDPDHEQLINGGESNRWPGGAKHPSRAAGESPASSSVDACDERHSGVGCMQHQRPRRLLAQGDSQIPR